MVGRLGEQRTDGCAAIDQQLSLVTQQLKQAKDELSAARADHQRLRKRFDLMCRATTDGLWDIETHERNPTDPGQPSWWSDHFRQLLGFSNLGDFPNVFGSWSSRLHPEDAEPTLAAFAAHVRDRTGRTPYDVTYRLLCRSGEYRWFRALGQTFRGAEGASVRVAGALTDITDRNAILELKRYAEEILASMPAGLMVVDDTLHVVSVNRSLRAIFGWDDEHRVSGYRFEAVLPDPGLRAQAENVLADGVTRNSLVAAIGEKHLRVAIAELRPAEQERRLLVVVEDVTEEQRLREQARAHAERYRDQASLLDKATDAIVVRSLDGEIQFWNKSAERLYGWATNEVLGKSALELCYDDPIVANDINDHVLCWGEWRGEVTHRRKDGTGFVVESHCTLVRDEAHEPKSMLIINTDITQRKSAEQRIQYLALYDALTGLPNRTLMTDRLTQALARAARSKGTLAVLFMDLNRFKEINDTQGHGVGDEVLLSVARRFQAALTPEESLARLSGDEFIVAAEVDGPAAAVRIAERLQEALAEPIATASHTFFIRASIGIAFYPQDGLTIGDLLKHADIAMYQAKALGEGHVLYKSDMSAGLAEQMEIAKDLNRAIRSGSLQLYYQPKVRLATGALVGAEALLRWNDPERGWVSPAQFIPIAEARRMMAALGKWVLIEGCSQLKAWREAGLRFPGRLAINVAAQQLEDSDVATRMQSIVSAAGLTPESLELELTESGVMANVDLAVDTMAALKAAGFALSIDDFGTGYSSLAYLKRLPVDKLKIDISFVRDMLTDAHDYTIVSTIIGMARNFGLTAIAEGVEDATQASRLLEMGCDEAQGYYFGRPMPAKLFAETWLRSDQIEP